MKRYRVAVQGDRITVEHRFLWIFWMPVQDYTNYAGSDDRLFASVEDAFEYIKGELKKAEDIEYIAKETFKC